MAGVAVDDKIPLPTRERMSPEAVTENFFIFFISDRKFFVSQLFNSIRKVRTGSSCVGMLVEDLDSPLIRLALFVPGIPRDSTPGQSRSEQERRA